MNPFRSRRKVKEGKEKEGKESQDSKDGGSSDSPSSLPTLAKKAKALAKPKRSPSHSRSPSPSAAPSLDLSTALPSDDAFRTSLLMPNLSARFSMLREQDDPASKLGKASDDSVLFPKRQSRLDGFAAAATAGRLPLADIDEVSSAHRDSAASGLESANGTGTGSDTGSGAASESGPPSGSIMDRRRPAESNNTFSGRQKFYRIPVGAGTAPSGKPRGGKIVYEDDVAMSAFQRHLRDKKRNAAVLESPTSPPADSQSPDGQPNQDGEPKQNGELKQEETVAHPQRDAPQRDADNSHRCQLEEANRTPSADVDRDNQPPPATVVATGKPDDGPGNEKPSPAPALATPSRGINRERRPLRLDSSSLNSQSPSANTPLSPTRLDSLRRRPALDAGALHRSLSRSATNLHERYQRRPVYAVGNVPPGTPGTPSTPGLPGGSRAASPSSPPLSRSSSLSRPVLPDDREPLAASLRPEDVGKATALGLFNKPVTASKYDEAQFSRRQLQMHQGRITPRSSSEQSSLDLDRSRFNRSRGQSLTKHESASSSARPSLSDDPPPRSPMRTIPQDLTSLMPDGDAGDDDAAAASQIHPAFRSSTPSTESASASRASSLRVSQSSEPRYPESDLNTIDENESLKGPPSPVEEYPVEEDHPSQFEDNTPTNPGGVGLGLSSLVNRLRPESQMFEQPSAPAPASSSTLSPPRSLGNNLRNQNTRSVHSVHSNPWELDEYCLDLPPVTATEPPSPSPAKPAAPAPPLTADSLVGMSARAKAMLEQAAALRGEQEQRQQQQQQQRSETDSKPPVRRPLQRAPASSSQDYDPASTNSYQHQREINADTQMEREDLAAELAERRRRVQEKLKSFAEAMEGSRSSSPFPSYVEPVSAPAAAPSSAAVTMKANPFALLKQRKRDESRERNRSVSPRQFTPTSTSRVLRLSGVSGEESIGMTSVPSVGAADSSGPGQSQQPMRNRSDSGQLRTRPGRSDSDVSGRSNGNGTAWSVYRASDRDRDQSADRYRLSEEAFRRPGGGGTATTAGSVASSARPSIDRDNSCSDFSATRRAPLPPVASGAFSYAPGYNGFGPGVNGNISSSYESGVSQTSSGATTTASGLTASSSTDMSSPRPSPNTPFYAANATPPIEHPAPTAAMPVLTPQMTQNSASGSSINLSNGNGSIHRTHTGAGARKRTIDKTQISEPILVSSTNDMPTTGLPPASLFGSPLTSLPIPPMNPRRRQTTTQAIFGAFRGDYHRGDRDLRVDSGNLPGSGCASPIPPSPSTRSGFFDDDSDDDDDDSGPFGTGSLRGMRSRSRSRSRSRIRKMVTSTVGDHPPPVPVLSRGQVQVHAQMQPQVPIEGDMI